MSIRVIGQCFARRQAASVALGGKTTTGLRGGPTACQIALAGKGRTMNAERIPACVALVAAVLLCADARGEDGIVFPDAGMEGFLREQGAGPRAHTVQPAWLSESLVARFPSRYPWNTASKSASRRGFAGSCFLQAREYAWSKIR